MADKKVAEQYYSPPPKLDKWEGFKLFLWNSETSQCLGRTGSSWAKIIFFYIVFYSALAGFFAAMLAVFYQTLDDAKPKWTLDNGLIGSNPGLGFRPMPPEENVESTLIWFDVNKPENLKHWINENAKFINETYIKSHPNRFDCSFDNPPEHNRACNIPLDKFGACTEKQNFGYTVGKPCIFLKLNKIYDWQPQIYNETKTLPKEMPEDLRNHIDQMVQSKPKQTNMIWVTCSGENPADVENIHSITYMPDRGYPAFYFPYRNQDGYIPPLVAVQFEVEYGVLINIECKAWARNIIHDRSERRGSVHFELMVDK